MRFSVLIGSACTLALIQNCVGFTGVSANKMRTYSELGVKEKKVALK